MPISKLLLVLVEVQKWKSPKILISVNLLKLKYEILNDSYF